MWTSFFLFGMMCMGSFVSDSMALTNMQNWKHNGKRRLILKDRLQSRREKEFSMRNKLNERELSRLRPGPQAPQRKRAFKRFMAHKDAKVDAEIF